MTKLEKLRAALSEKGIDAVLIYDELNQRYRSDFAFSDGLLVITKDKAALITDFRYYEMAGNKANKAFNVVMPENRNEYILGVLSESGAKTVGFEGKFVSYERYRMLCEKFPGYEFVNIGAMIEDIREIKTPEEIALMQKAQDIADTAFSHATYRNH